MTTLAWGGIAYEVGYKCAGEYENLLDAIKWGTDYFIKCHTKDNEYYAQVRMQFLCIDTSIQQKQTCSTALKLRYRLNNFVH